MTISRRGKVDAGVSCPVTDEGASLERPRRIDLARAPDFDLGGLRVRPARRQVRGPAGDCRDLEPRVMQVLVALASARGEVVSRDALIESCWDGLAVGDDSITRCMVALRRLARSVDPEPFAIDTVARVGYCLVERRPEGDGDARSFGGAMRRRFVLPAIAAAIAAALALGLFPWPAPPGRTQGPPQVELASVRALSPSLPPAIADSFREELAATLQAENALMVVDPDGERADGPRHSVTATIQQVGNALRFTVHLRNERTGASLWSHMFERPAANLALAPPDVAGSISRVVRCGLAGAGPALARMPDRILYLWLQYCAERWTGEPNSQERMRDAASRVAAAAPDFSPGWSALAFHAVQIQLTDPAAAAESNAQAARAASQALRLDPQNSEAFAALGLGHLLDGEFVRAEAEFRNALGARPTDCGCEHNVYGQMLYTVGRVDDAVAHFQRAYDMQPLAHYSRLHLAEGLLSDGRDEGRRILEEAAQLWPGDLRVVGVQVRTAFWTGRYQEGLRALGTPGMAMPETLRAALAAAFEALESGSGERRARAAALLQDLARSPVTNNQLVTTALGALGENRAAMDSAVANRTWAEGILFEPSFAQARRDPAFPALVQRLGMVRYWRQTRHRPDDCRGANAPDFCRMP